MGFATGSVSFRRFAVVGKSPSTVDQDMLDKLAEHDFAGMRPELRAELLTFFGDPNAPYATKRNPKEWSRVEAELQQLKSTTPQPVTADAVPASF